MGSKARAIDRAERVAVTNRAEWRAWLTANHTRESGIWLVFYKKRHALYLPWNDIVQEALCFGWIDSLARKLDDDRTMLYVSPRKPGSAWSGLNKKHIAELEDTGLIHPAGQAKIDAARRDGSWTLLDDIEAMLVPSDLAVALDGTPGARAGYDSFRPSARRGLLWWIKCARTEATRHARIARTAEQAARGKVANA